MTSPSENQLLSDVSILVTGATGGIGSAVVKACLVHGATVFAGGRDSHKLDDLRNSLEPSLTTRLYSLLYDITNEQAVKGAFREVQTHISKGNAPSLYGLVNNAGSMLEAALAVTNMDALQQQLQINFLAPYQHMQLASRLMSRARRGSIVNITSQVSEQGSKGMSAYAASKAALSGATKSLAKELAPLGIRVNAVAPGFIDTGLIQHYEDESKLNVINRIVMKRQGYADEVAAAVVHLLSNQASYTTGHTLPVDGMFCP